MFLVPKTESDNAYDDGPHSNNILRPFSLKSYFFLRKPMRKVNKRRLSRVGDTARSDH